MVKQQQPDIPDEENGPGEVSSASSQRAETRRKSDPLTIMKTGMILIAKEVGRLAEKIEIGDGLSGTEAKTLQDYLLVCSRLRKDNKALSQDYITDEDLETMSEEELASHVNAVAAKQNIDLGGMKYPSKNREENNED